MSNKPAKQCGPYMTWVVVIIITLLGLVRGDLYDEAITELQQLPDRDEIMGPIYNEQNIYDNLYVPQYNDTSNEYESEDSKIDILHDYSRYKKPLEKLELAASANDIRALLALGDIFIYGNYSIKTDYQKALHYYHKVVDLESNGHAYFMLGFIYSTGLFGEIPEDQSRATLYYHFAAENNNINAILALARRFAEGIGTAANSDIALLYYHKAANIGMDFIKNDENFDDLDDLVSYDISLPDFNGGIYGHKMSETPSSVLSGSNLLDYTMPFLNEYHIDADDHEYVEYYSEALHYYKGDYFKHLNRTKAFQVAQQCVSLGHSMYGARKYQGIDALDRYFLGKCQAMLGHMYLKGLGAERNYEKAKLWLMYADTVGSNSDAQIDLGLMYENNLIGGNVSNSSLIADNYFKKAIKSRSSMAEITYARVLMDRVAKNGTLDLSYEKEILNLVFVSSVQNFNKLAMYYLPKTSSVGVYSSIVFYGDFVNSLERYFFPHLKYAFQELIHGEFKNALIGYLIAAEQGLTNACVSTAYLLYQFQPLSLRKNYKTFTHVRTRWAMKFLDRVSHSNRALVTDAVIQLGDIYLNGDVRASIVPDSNIAFRYFNRVAAKSPHASYKIGYMYEYGLVPLKNSMDYFMAKRYYDQSLELLKGSNQGFRINNVLLHWSLLRLRLKFLLSKKKKNDNQETENTNWLNTIKKISSDESEVQLTRYSEMKAQANLEGTAFFVDEEYDIADYLVISLTLFFFLFFFIQNVWRRIRGGRNNVRNERDNADNRNDNNNGLFNFRRGNFEIHFFAI